MKLFAELTAFAMAVWMSVINTATSTIQQGYVPGSAEYLAADGLWWTSLAVLLIASMFSCYLTAQRKGLSKIWVWIGFCLGPIGCVIALMVPRRIVPEAKPTPSRTETVPNSWDVL